MKLAGAPISWCVCEVPGWGAVLPPHDVLADMSELGLRATELGPPDYLPTDPDDLRDVEQPVGTLSGGERQCVAWRARTSLDQPADPRCPLTR